MSTNAPFIRSDLQRLLDRARRTLARLARAGWDAGRELIGMLVRASSTPLGLAVWLAGLFGAVVGGLARLDLVIDDIAAARADSAAAVAVDAEPDPLLARISGYEIRLSDVRRFAVEEELIGPEEALTPAAAREREILDRYLEQQLMARAARIDGLADEATVRAELDAAARRILAARYYERRIADATGEEAVRDIYDRMVALADFGEEVRARYAVLRTEDEANALIADFREGRAFGELARERSIDAATARAGGDLGYFAREMMAPELADAAFETEVGAVSAPFKTEFGWNVVLVQDRRKRRSPRFSDMRPEIEQFLALEEVNAMIDELNARFYVERLDPAGE